MATDIRQERALRGNVSPGADTTNVRLERGAAAAANPATYRDQVGFNKKYGATMTSQSAAALDSSLDAFNKSIGSARGQVSRGYSDVERQYSSGKNTLASERSTALSSVGNKKSLSDEYNKWKKTWHRLDVMTGKSPGNPGGQENTLWVPKEAASQYFSVLTRGGYPVYNNKVYINNRGAELYNSYSANKSNWDSQWYGSAGKQISNYNNSVDKAKGTIETQYVAALNSLHAQVSQAKGRLSGQSQGLDAQVAAQNKEISDISKSYQDRLARINDAISLTVDQQRAKSRASLKAPVPPDATTPGTEPPPTVPGDPATTPPPVVEPPPPSVTEPPPPVEPPPAQDTGGDRPFGGGRWQDVRAAAGDRTGAGDGQWRDIMAKWELEYGVGAGAGMRSPGERLTIREGRRG